MVIQKVNYNGIYTCTNTSHVNYNEKLEILPQFGRAHGFCKV